MILHQVLTTERVPFSYRVAGLGSRTLAWLIDFALIIVLSVAGMLFFSVLDIRREGFGGGRPLVGVRRLLGIFPSL